MRACGEGAKRSDGTIVLCNLPIGHGGNHAERVIERVRPEVDRMRGGYTSSQPTAVYRTLLYWADGDAVATRWRAD